MESPAGEEPIPVRRDLTVAFIGPAPRGPAHIPVAINSVAEFRKRFGSPVERSRLEWVLAQFFDNGGRTAIVVRVPRSGGGNRLTLPGPGGDLELVATNPGPLECLRASVDRDGLPAGDPQRFNLTLQRLHSFANPLVEEQEIWRDLSTAPADPRYVGDVLAGSTLVQLAAPPPARAPAATPGSPGNGPVGYVNCRGNWRDSAPPTDYDLIGSERDCTGLHALEQVAAVDLVCLLSGRPGGDLGPVVLFAAERYCARRQALLLLDPPNHWTSVADVLRSQRERGFASPNVVTYFPALVATRADGRRSRPASALGAIAGMLVRQEREGGGGEAVAETGSLLRSQAGVALSLESAEAVALARAGVNALRQAGTATLAFTGFVTLGRDGASRREWLGLPVRRRVLGILGAIARGTRWLAAQPGQSAARAALSAQVAAYLVACGQAGLLPSAGKSPGRSYVKCDAETNHGRQAPTFVVGLHLPGSGAFVAFRFEQHLEGCTVTELVWQPPLALAG